MPVSILRPNRFDGKLLARKSYSKSCDRMYPASLLILAFTL